MALGEVIVTQELDHAFHRFGAGIAEEDEVGKALLAQPRRQLLAVRTLEQVRHVPKLRRLFLQGCDQMRMRVAKRVHRNAGGEIEVALAIGSEQPAALAMRKAEIDPGKYRKQMRRRTLGHRNHQFRNTKSATLNQRHGEGWSRPPCAHWRGRIDDQNSDFEIRRNCKFIASAPWKQNVPPFRGGTWQAF